jgi:hypothetical protein
MGLKSRTKRDHDSQVAESDAQVRWVNLSAFIEEEKQWRSKIKPFELL